MLNKLYDYQGKGSESRHSFPLTGMAAHAADDLIDAIEFDEKPVARESTKASENDVDYGTKSAYMPPPPPVAQNACKQVIVSVLVSSLQIRWLSEL